MAVSANGKTFAAVWMDFQREEGNRDVFWTLKGKKVRLLGTETRGEQGHPAVVCDGDGAFWAAWEHERAGKFEIWISKLEKGATARRLSQPDKDGSSSFPSLAAAGDRVLAVYETEAKVVILRTIP